MKKGEKKRHEIIEKTADYILLNGLQAASLRNLAKAAETSDRMLLHYFNDKAELLTAVLSFISKRLVHMLHNTEMEKLSFQNLVPYLYKLMQDPQVRPYMKLYIELIAVASKGSDPFNSVAKEILDIFYEFYIEVIQVEEGENKEQMAALALVTIEGIALLDALGDDVRIKKAIDAINSGYF
ncbi:TetR/AcrR family transcriptional regulator [Bacillus sp. HMF5848]|uniref:TetR/AcrR family transcriptional regulator n=1 Tax=Bacillus sp. HMF5848 TaxID=2495421 RepID=UPI000F7AD854|nr:TetR/AcrR family transcriptional regulator [Bacillus sp. HMF5848]RSK26095.1 TetR/AcrR family transcriptional regulator [Bacillus sp. HMF5848]